MKRFFSLVEKTNCPPCCKCKNLFEISLVTVNNKQEPAFQTSSARSLFSDTVTDCSGILKTFMILVTSYESSNFSYGADNVPTNRAF